MGDKNKILDKKVVNTTFSSIINAYSEYPDIQKRMYSMNALIVSSSNFDIQDTCFPQGTIDFYQYLQRNSSPKLNVGIAVVDEQYKESAQYTETIELATIILGSVCFPIIINLISCYIFEKCFSKKSEVVSEILINKNSSTISYKYRGPAETYEKTMLNILKSEANELTDGSEEK